MRMVQTSPCGIEAQKHSTYLDEYGSERYWLEDGLSKEEPEWRKGLSAQRKAAKRIRCSVHRIAWYLDMPGVPDETNIGIGKTSNESTVEVKQQL